MPVGNAVLLFVHGHGVAEEDRAFTKLHAHPHGERAVHVCFAGCRNAVVVQHGQYRAVRCAVLCEQIRPAARGERADFIFRDKLVICLIKFSVIDEILLRRTVQSVHEKRRFFQICPAVLRTEALRTVKDLRQRNADETGTEAGLQFFFPGAAETKALGRFADRRHPKRLHFLPETRGADHGEDRITDRILVG